MEYGLLVLVSTLCQGVGWIAWVGGSRYLQGAKLGLDQSDLSPNCPVAKLPQLKSDSQERETESDQCSVRSLKGTHRKKSTTYSKMRAS